MQRQMIVSQQEKIDSLYLQFERIFWLYEWGEMLYPIENKVLSVVADIQWMRDKLGIHRSVGMLRDHILNPSSLQDISDRDKRKKEGGNEVDD